MPTFLCQQTETEEAFTTDVRTPLKSERWVITNLWAKYSFLCCRLFCLLWCYEKCSLDYVRSHCPKYDVKKISVVTLCMSKNISILLRGTCHETFMVLCLWGTLSKIIYWIVNSGYRVGQGAWPITLAFFFCHQKDRIYVREGRSIT